jgi:elongation factor P
MKTGNTVEKTFKAGEQVEDAVLEKAQMQHTYMDGSDFVFMNMETYEEERINAKALGHHVVNYMMEGLIVEVLKHNQDILGIELPKSMTLTVAQTDPGVKGNTVQGGTKPATLETGATVMVPLFINEGEKIVVNTEENKYVSRFNE